MKKRVLEIRIGILISFLLVSILIAGMIIVLPKLKKTQIDIAKNQADEIESMYANESTDAVDQTWDVSQNQDGSVKAKWTLSNKTLTISGSGKMKDWIGGGSGDYHSDTYVGFIQKIIIEDGITYIGQHAFAKCSGLTSVEIPNSVTSIGGWAFRDCSSLEKVEIPNGITSLETNIFESCIRLKEITIPNSVTSIGNDAFFGCGFETIEIPNSVTSIGESAFAGCTKLKEMIIPSKVKNIYGHAFYNCSRLEWIAIPNSVTYIGNGTIGNGVAENCITKIYCKANSKAEEYAKTENIKYVSDAIKATPKLSITEPTNKDITVTITTNKPINGVNGWELLENKMTLTKTYTENATENVAITDLLGDNTTANITVSNIDKEAPTVSVSYSTTNPTNQSVTATITANEPIQEVSGWTISTDKKKLTKTYTENATETITIKDLAGNVAEYKYNNISMYNVVVKITNIDKTAPKANVSYSSTAVTNQNVTAKITADKELQGINGWNLSSDKKTLTKIYTENATETVTIKDLAGNSTTATVKITNIDKTAPTTNVSYSTTTATNQNVKVTITANKKIKQVEGWTISTDQKTLTKTYTINQKETVTITDLAGNTTIANISVTNIDKTEISAIVKYSTTLITNKNINVTITTNKKVKPISGWTISSDGKTLTKTYENNSKETITLQDEAGNTKKIEINVENIDKVKPIIEEIKYSINEQTNQNVTVTITTNKIVQEIEGWTLSEDKKTLTKEYTENTSAEGEKIDIKDLAGNSPEKDAIVKITNIDKIAPELQVKYSTTSETTEGVIVTITSNEEIQPVEGWELSDDKKSLTKTYTSNQDEDVTIYDMGGNESKNYSRKYSR